MGLPQVLYPSAGESCRYLWHDTHMNQADFRRNSDAGVTPLGHDVFEIDTRMAGYSQITASFLVRADRPCLVETGTAPSAPVVRDALAALGVGPGDLATVVVTHIHLDHAGGVGDIAENGDDLDWLFGELAPTPAGRIRAVGERGSVDLGGGRTLDSHYSPGHAKHHVGLIDSVSGDLYVGDAAGVFLPQTGDLRPASPPPDFDLPVALESLRLFDALAPQRLLFSHYGPVDDVTATLERSAEELNVWVAETRRARGEGLDLDHTVAMVRDRTRERYAALLPGADPEITEKAERISSTQANVEGILRWLEQTEPAAG